MTIILLLTGILFAIVSKRNGKGSKINSATFFGATSEFQDIDQKAAIEHMLEV